MQIQCCAISDVKAKQGDALVVGITEGQKDLASYKGILSSVLLEKIDRFIKRDDFSFKKNDILSFDIEKPVDEKLYMVVMSKSPTVEGVRQACARAVDYANSQAHEAVRLMTSTFLADGITLSDFVESVSEIVDLTLYRYDVFKPQESKAIKIKMCQFVVAKGEDLNKLRKSLDLGRTIAQGVNFTRDLVNTPANELPPRVMGDRAAKMAKECGIAVKVIGKSELVKMKMGGILAVSQGSVEEPRLIVLEVGNPKTPADFVLVGKGVTFDSGGISIKPSDGMEKMKYDMAGGAAVIGTMMNIARLGLEGHFVGIIPAAENMPSGSAIRPGDVIWMGSGKSVEVLNTDAEGRLLLGDGLFYAQRFKPKAVIDLATLTGAVVVALGTLAIGLLGNDDHLIRQIKRAGEETGERAWELPLWDEYLEQIKGDVAEIKNVGGKGAGTITAAMFLKQFVNYHWAHLDIAGTAWADEKKPYCVKGATGVGVRLLTNLLRNWRK